MRGAFSRKALCRFCVPSHTLEQLERMFLGSDSLQPLWRSVSFFSPFSNGQYQTRSLGSNPIWQLTIENLSSVYWLSGHIRLFGYNSTAKIGDGVLSFQLFEESKYLNGQRAHHICSCNTIETGFQKHPIRAQAEKLIRELLPTKQNHLNICYLRPTHFSHSKHVFYYQERGLSASFVSSLFTLTFDAFQQHSRPRLISSYASHSFRH